jgi:hypothetical protein
LSKLQEAGSYVGEVVKVMSKVRLCCNFKKKGEKKAKKEKRESREHRE